MAQPARSGGHAPKASLATPTRRGRADASGAADQLGRPLSVPPIDPLAIERAYRLERAKRRARIERMRARRLAGLRFLAVLVALLALSIFLSLTIWREIERLFGL